MEEAAVQAAAATLWDLWSSGKRLLELPPDQRPHDLDDAWAVQRALDRFAGPRVGWKLASTSPSGQAAIGIDHPLIGVLYERQLVANHSTVPVPSIGIAEGEFAFRIRGDLDCRAAPFTREAVLAHVGSVLPGIEVPDFRIGEYPQMRAPDLVADFMGAGHYLLGAPMLDVELSTLPEVEVAISRNGVEEARGRGADVLGDPCDALVWLANEIAERGEGFRDGDVVTTGGCAYIEAVKPGDEVTATIGGHRVGVSFATG